MPRGDGTGPAWAASRNGNIFRLPIKYRTGRSEKNSRFHLAMRLRGSNSWEDCQNPLWLEAKAKECEKMATELRNAAMELRKHNESK